MKMSEKESEFQQLICDYCNKPTDTWIKSNATEVITKCWKCKKLGID